MNIVIVGHVDHGKSTIIGRLMADTRSLPEGKLEQVKERCRRNSKPFEYAFLLDALKDEQNQGITIDTARCFFTTEKRRHIIIDAPGHIEFLKNMVTGASRAEAALLVIAADEGVRKNSRRHGYMLSLLGIRQAAVLVNKMDLVGYSKETYRSIVTEYSRFLKKINIDVGTFIPVSGIKGDNIAANDRKNMPWHKGKSVLEILYDFKAEELPLEKPFRMPVQAVYKFTEDGDNRRCIAGTIESGRIRVGDKIVFYPSGKKSSVKSIERFNAENPDSLGAGYAAAFTTHEQIYIKRGELAVIDQQPRPEVTSRLKVSLFWLNKNPMQRNKPYHLKIGTAKVDVKLEEITGVIDASNLRHAKKTKIERHDVAECILKTDKAVAFDTVKDFLGTSRFVIIDNYEIAGGGTVQEAIEDKQSWVREKVLLRNYKWEGSSITPEIKAKKYNQKSALVLITGEKDVGKKRLAKTLEQKLFNDAKFVYFLGIGNVLYGVDADIKGRNHNVEENRQEHLRRLAEISNLLLDAGVILIVTATELRQEDLGLIKTAVDQEKIETIWVGENVTTDISFDAHIPAVEEEEKAANMVMELLQNKGVIFKPW